MKRNTFFSEEKVNFLKLKKKLAYFSNIYTFAKTEFRESITRHLSSQIVSSSNFVI